MNILQVNTLDNQGGAAKVAYRLKNSLMIKGHNVKMLVSRKLTKDEDVIKIEYKRKLIKYFNSKRFYEFMLPTKNFFLQSDNFMRADVVHLHNLHGGYFNILSLPKISKLKPVVWTLHDPWIIFPNSMIPEYSLIFQSEPSYYSYLKKLAINRSRMILVSPSKWLKTIIESIYSDREVIVIPNGIDVRNFKRRDRQSLRRRLKLPVNKRVIVTVAQGGKDNIQKGWKQIDKLYSLLSLDDLIIVCIGGVNDNQNKSIISVPYLKNEKVISEYYSASDVFLSMSLAENFPLVVLEAMSCGLPVISYDVGGVKEIVKHGQTGYIARYNQIGDIAEGIVYFLSMGKDKFEYCSRRASLEIIKKYTLDRMTKSYLNLYESAMKNI